jgi:uncharacterized protein YdeI (YjbR/CyaY-like superfamily)
MMTFMPGTDDSDFAPAQLFETQADWSAWLEENHARSPGIWLRLAKKGVEDTTVTLAQAIETALSYGWIDGPKRPDDAEYWLQRFTPRAPGSAWSKNNRAKAEALIANGTIRPAGLAAVERARADGRWDSAYDSASTATIPPDLAAALAGNSKAAAFFATLEARNRYSILYRLQTAKKEETRARRLKQFVEMLERGEKIHP